MKVLVSILVTMLLSPVFAQNCDVTGQTTRQLSNGLEFGIQYCADDTKVHWITPGCIVSEVEYEAIGAEGGLAVAVVLADKCEQGKLPKTPVDTGSIGPENRDREHREICVGGDCNKT